jgi:hypothetical protein
MKIKLSKIKVDQGTQSRETINTSVVSDYAQILSEGGVLPAVDVFFDGLDYYLADGFHRYFAHKQIVAPEIECNLHNGSLAEAEDFSYSANYGHGLQRTTGDKKKIALYWLMHKIHNKLSDREIAKKAHLSYTFISSMRKSIQAPQPAVREVTRNGKTYEMKARQPKEEVVEVDTELDEAHELEITNKALAEEIDMLNDKLAVASIQGSEEDKSRATETIAELRAKIKTLEAENDGLKSSLQTYMSKNAEMIKQLNYYKRRIEKMEKAVA